MSDKQQIEFIIKPDGTVEERVMGVSGPDCEKVTAAIENQVNELFVQLTGIESIDPEIELTNQGLDSMSGTELISKLEKTYSVEIGPDILFEYPFKDPFVDRVYALSIGGREFN